MGVYTRKEVVKVTERLDQSVYRTETLRSIWLEVRPRSKAAENKIAAEYGGDFLASTTDTRVGPAPKETHHD